MAIITIVITAMAVLVRFPAVEVDCEPDYGCPTFGKSFLASRPRKVIVNTVVIPDDWEGIQDWSNVADYANMLQRQIEKI